MQKEFKNLACDEKLKSEHVGGNENQACDGKQKFKHSKHKI